MMANSLFYYFLVSRSRHTVYPAPAAEPLAGVDAGADRFAHGARHFRGARRVRGPAWPGRATVHEQIELERYRALGNASVCAARGSDRHVPDGVRVAGTGGERRV